MAGGFDVRVPPDAVPLLGGATLVSSLLATEAGVRLLLLTMAYISNAPPVSATAPTPSNRAVFHLRYLLSSARGTAIRPLVRALVSPTLWLAILCTY